MYLIQITVMTKMEMKMTTTMKMTMRMLMMMMTMTLSTKVMMMMMTMMMMIGDKRFGCVSHLIWVWKPSHIVMACEESIHVKFKCIHKQFEKISTLAPLTGHCFPCVLVIVNYEDGRHYICWVEFHAWQSEKVQTKLGQDQRYRVLGVWVI